MKEYLLLDSGNELKLEKFGSFIIKRPCMQAFWKPQLSTNIWGKYDLSFTRKDDKKWEKKTKIPQDWIVEIDDIVMKIMPTNFGHLGLFPEHIELCRLARSKIRKIENKKLSILNLFAYSGLMSMFLAKENADVCHLDASDKIISLAKENAKLNNFSSFRWIIDDVMKFVKREIRRGKKYDAIILDPPTFGRGPKGEIFKIERDILQLLEMCNELLSQDALFLLFSCHTPGFTSQVMKNLMAEVFSGKKGEIEANEMVIEAKNSFLLPSGFYAIWENC